MQTGRSVQFQQVADVISAYELRAVPAFSIYQGKQLLHKYEGENIEEGIAQLEAFLPMLHNSAAIYTLCVYEEFTGRINDKSPYHGSWNFKFNENTQGFNAAGNVMSRLEAQITEMNEKLNRLETERELDEGQQSGALGTMDKIGEVLSHPLVERLLPVVMGFLNNSTAAPAAAKAQLSGINVNDKAFSNQLSDAIYNMLDAAEDTEKVLIKLGRIAKEDPKKFKGLLTYVNFI